MRIHLHRQPFRIGQALFYYGVVVSFRGRVRVLGRRVPTLVERIAQYGV